MQPGQQELILKCRKRGVVEFDKNIVIVITMFGKLVHCYSINNMVSCCQWGRAGKMPPRLF